MSLRGVESAELSFCSDLEQGSYCVRKERIEASLSGRADPLSEGFRGKIGTEQIWRHARKVARAGTCANLHAWRDDCAGRVARMQRMAVPYHRFSGDFYFSSFSLGLPTRLHRLTSPQGRNSK
jgi:hypothetical protein